MDQQLKETLFDLEILSKNSEQDYQEKRYECYEQYVIEFNRLVSILHELGLFITVNSIAQVPEENKADYGLVGTVAEVAKHREVVSDSQKLIHRLRNLVGRTDKLDIIQILEQLLSSFHKVSRQLRSRHGNRPTLDIDDEYDVQDLLHALLKIYFDDIRPEEWTPSYAGGSKRMDFLLKNEKIVIEVKKTRKNLSDKVIGEQLLVDIETYKQHSDCSTLFCFVYDPEGRIGNPIGLENDLAAQSRANLNVVVRIYPK